MIVGVSDKVDFFINSQLFFVRLLRKRLLSFAGDSSFVWVFSQSMKFLGEFIFFILFGVWLYMQFTGLFCLRKMRKRGFQCCQWYKEVSSWEWLPSLVKFSLFRKSIADYRFRFCTVFLFLFYRRKFERTCSLEFLA